MALTKKQYNPIAKILSEVGDSSGHTGRFVVDQVSERLASFFAQDNERFNQEQFLDAAGVVA